jgi:hypothetical protein
MKLTPSSRRKTLYVNPSVCARQARRTPPRSILGSRLLAPVSPCSASLLNSSRAPIRRPSGRRRKDGSGHQDLSVPAVTSSGRTHQRRERTKESINYGGKRININYTVFVRLSNTTQVTVLRSQGRGISLSWLPRHWLHPHVPHSYLVTEVTTHGFPLKVTHSPRGPIDVSTTRRIVWTSTWWTFTWGQVNSVTAISLPPQTERTPPFSHRIMQNAPPGPP